MSLESPNIQLSAPRDTTDDDFVTLRRSLLRYCEVLTQSHHEAEDVVQTTLLKALPVLQSGQHANVSAFLRRIAKNTWLDTVRKQSRISLHPTEDWSVSSLLHHLLATTDHTDESDFDFLAAQTAIRLLMANLTPQQHAVFLLCDVFDYTDSEAATLLDTTRGAVKATLHRVRRRLQVLRNDSVHPVVEGEEPYQKLQQQESRCGQKTGLHQAPAAAETSEENRRFLNAYLNALRAVDINALLKFCGHTISSVTSTMMLVA